MPDLEQDRKNRELIEALRKTLNAVADRLTPDVEPPVIYVVKPPTKKNDGK